MNLNRNYVGDRTVKHLTFHDKLPLSIRFLSSRRLPRVLDGDGATTLLSLAAQEVKKPPPRGVMAPEPASPMTFDASEVVRTNVTLTPSRKSSEKSVIKFG